MRRRLLEEAAPRVRRAVLGQRCFDLFEITRPRSRPMTNAVTEPGVALPPVSRILGAAAFACALLGLLLLASLHILRPDLDPSQHFISEYAVGAHGWVMAFCFLSLGLGCASIIAVLITEIQSVTGRVGLGFLFAAMLGLVMAAAFPMDPLSVAPENASFSGHMHGVAAAIGNPGFIIGATLITLALRKNSTWARVK